MMRAAFVLLSLAIFCDAEAASPKPKALDKDAVNEAAWSGRPIKGISPALIKAQVLLDRARFSPGVIDGHDGDNFQEAVKAFERARNLKLDGVVDEEVWAKLNEGSPAPALVEYKIAEEDVRGPFVQIPEKFEDQAALDRLGYSSPLELLAEKFHMDPDLLEALNPGKPFNRSGTMIVVANVREQALPDKARTKVAKIEVVKSERILRALAEDGGLIAVYPASIGSEKKPAPTGEFTVRAIAENPTYTYNPDYAFEGVKSDKKFVIKPGPNNPVGSVWIDLSADSFGIHGTSEPEKVGKTYSHGCARLTNWDAEDLAKLVQKGTRVTFLD